MSKTSLQDFLTVLDQEPQKQLKIKTTTRDSVLISPLSFKQQKELITSGLDGVVGIMSLIKNLNNIILNNSGEEDLKLYDRVPIILGLRKELSSKPISKDDTDIEIDDLINQFKKFEHDTEAVIEGDVYEIHLKIPTLKQENRSLSICIEDLKKIGVENIGKNVSLVLSYEIPKFIDKIVFGDNVLKFEELAISDKTKILDNLPANITNKITDFILKVREYDEALLTFNGITIDIDSTFFE